MRKMKMINGLLLVVLSLALSAVFGCDAVTTQNVKWDAGQNNNYNYNYNYNTNNNNTEVPDASMANIVRFTGVTWSPGADGDSTLEENRFPIPGALVAAYNSPPEDLPQEMYCNECVDISTTVPHVISDPVDGSFELSLLADTTYYLVVQKGEFRRVRQIHIPDDTGGEYTLESEAPGVPRPEETTLPNSTNLELGDNIPKIALIDGVYEDQSIMFEALGFNYDVEFDVYEGSSEVGSLVGSYDNLAQYNLIIAPCGDAWVGGSSDVENIKEYVRNGGKLYIDDFSYDFAEQVWPEFLTFYVESSGVCGEGDTPPPPNECNNWSQWDFTGTPGDDDFADWIALPGVNGNNPIELQAAWDSIMEINSGEVGIDEEYGTGPNGELYLPPRVWMYGNDTPAGADKPTTVSWPFYCGKVLYTVYHTHDTGSSPPYELLLQEKIMMYLIMEVQACSEAPIVD